MNYEAVVIGASTAGLIAAEKLAGAGRKVAVFEQGPSLSAEKRTYIITQGILRVVPDLDQELIQNRIHSIAVQAGEKSAAIGLAVPDLVIERSELIESLYHRALHAGAEVRFNSQFLKIGEEGIEIRIDGEVNLLQAKALIGADGVKSRLRAESGLGRVPVLPLLQAEVDLPLDWDCGVTHVWFDPDQTSYFFWLIPDGDKRGVLGLIADPGTDIRRLLDEFAADRGIKLQHFQSGLAANYLRSLKSEYHLSGVRVLFAGDAAAQVKVTTVGGTVTGLVGGIAAAKAILDGSSYSLELKRLTRELDLHLFIRDLLGNMDRDDYERMIKALNPSVVDFLSRHDRDAMRNHFWKLALLQPVFIPLGLKLLFRWITGKNRTTAHRQYL